MRVIEGRDVNELYWRGMNMLASEGVEEPSRNGPVRVMPGPVTSVYHVPTRRVLLDRDRKANPFFHLFESLWMLAGRNDVGALNRYITDFGTRFAEADGRVHGAYGHRWRRAMGYDQLNCIVHQLKEKPDSRQAVLQMWDGSIHTYDSPGCNDLLGVWNDRPCNTHVYFRIRHEMAVDGLVGSFTSRTGQWPILDMQINCRSNDIVYGAYGANAVHFSVLHEYMAGRLGVLVGKMYQVSFNYHAYYNVLSRVPVPKRYETYEANDVIPLAMGTAWDKWDDDLEKWFHWHHNMTTDNDISIRSDYANSWFAHTASPMFIAHWRFKNALKSEARSWVDKIDAPDWRLACAQWMDQRTEARSR